MIFKVAYSAKCLTEDNWKQFGQVNCLIITGECRNLITACRKVGLRVERYYVMKKELLREEINENHSGDRE